MKFARYKHDSEFSYAEGATLVFELLKTKSEIITQIFLRPAQKYGDDIHKILQLAQEKNIPITETNKPFNVLAAKNACLLIAEFKKYPTQLEPNANHLLLVNPSDAGNLGTIIRIADWFGIDTIVCSHDTADAYNPKTVQATMGSIARVRVVYTDLAEAIRSLPDGYPVFATLLDGDNIYATDLPPSGMIVMGNEGNGISREVRSLITNKILIPDFATSSDKAESLNVAIATAITCSEFRRKAYAKVN